MLHYMAALLSISNSKITQFENVNSGNSGLGLEQIINLVHTIVHFRRSVHEIINILNVLTFFVSYPTFCIGWVSFND